MIVPDLNLLLYAHADAFQLHDPAREWWETLLSSDTEVGVAPVVASGFVRLTTSRRVLDPPVQTEAAVATVESWLAQPHVRMLSTDQAHFEATAALLRAMGTASNLTTDAQIAAHAQLSSGTVATHDTDFARFPGVPVIRPLD